MGFLSQDFGTKLTHKIAVNYKRNNSKVNDQLARMQAVFSHFSRRHQHAIIRAYTRTLIEKRKETEGRQMPLWQLCAAAPLHQLFSMDSSVAISDHYCPLLPTIRS
jgi:hypothetical protein